MKKKQLFSLFLCSLVPWVLGNGLLPLLPVYASRVGAGTESIGYYLSISYFALALGTLAAGWLSDKLQQRKKTLIIGGVMVLPSVWFMGQVTNTWQLTLLTAVVWFLGGGILTLIMILAGIFAEKKERGKVFGILALTGALGAVIGGATIGSIADRWGYPTLFTSLALFSCLLPLTGLLLEDKSVQQHSKESSQNAGSVLKSGFYLVIIASILASIILFIGRMGTSVAMNQLKFLSAEITSTAAIGGLISLPLSPLAGWLSDRISRKLLLGICFFAGACGMVTLAISISLWHFWTAASLLYIQSIVGTGIGSALITDLVPTELLGRGLSVYNSTGWIGGIIGFAISGVAIENFGISLTFMVGAFIVLIAIILLIPVQYHRSFT